MFTLSPTRRVLLIPSKTGIITTSSKKVLIVGGGFTGDYLAGELLKAGKECNNHGRNIQNCKAWRKKYPKAKISYGNAESVEVLMPNTSPKKMWWPPSPTVTKPTW